MLKIFLLLTLGFLASCGDRGSSNGQIEYYQYGVTALPGSLPPLGPDYVPKNLSPKVFAREGLTYAPMDLLSQSLTLSFDVQTSKVRGKSLLRFEVHSDGHPYFELSAPVSDSKLNSLPMTVSKISDPEGQGQSFWALDQSAAPGTVYELEVDYELPEGRVSFTDGGVRFLTSMTDLNAANFFESWGPVGFEQDAFSLSLELLVPNSSSTHTLYTNGELADEGPGRWKIEFPHYFTKSSFYVHLTTQSQLSVRHLVYSGKEKDIPVTVYGPSNVLVEAAADQLPELFREFETDYGPYPHTRFLAYMNGRGGGMEYAGATITSVGSLDHELFHSWFARSVIPAEGRSGWIDEALASWRDRGYFQAPSLLSRRPTNLSKYSPFRKSTPSNCYVDGRELIAELDRVVAPFGGMKVLLRHYFERYENRVVTNEEFWFFLNSVTGLDLRPYLERYTLGGESSAGIQLASEPLGDTSGSRHPKPLSAEEIAELR